MVFWGKRGGGRFDLLGKLTPKEQTHHQNTFCVHWVFDVRHFGPQDVFTLASFYTVFLLVR